MIKKSVSLEKGGTSMQRHPLLRQHPQYETPRHHGLRGSISAVLLFTAVGLFAQENDFEKQVSVAQLPVPNEKKQLFYLQRDPDENTVIYQLNLDGDQVDTDKPVNVYWIRYTEGGERKGLSFVQRTMAYGITHKALENGDFDLRIAAYKNLRLRLSYCKKNQQYLVFTSINNREAILDRIFVRIDGGNMLNPDITYFELCGRDAQTYAKVTQRIKP